MQQQVALKTHFFFLLGQSFLFTHELDAIKQLEYRMFPLVSLLPSEQAYVVFTLIHIPLFFILMYAMVTALQYKWSRFVIACDVFFVVHVFLHLGFWNHEHNYFAGALSWFIIIGTGCCGIADLLVKFLVNEKGKLQ